jgi:uncharacterized protein (TIGR02117 family)
MAAMRRKRTWIGLGVAAVPLSYGVAGLVGGALPANGGWVAPEQGVRIYVEDNGIHTGVVLPVEAAGVDLRDLTPARVLRDPRYAGHAWRSYGWGDRDFYVHTPTWWDLNPLTVLRAAIGSDATVMHVDFVPEPKRGDGTRTLVLRPDEYRRLATFVRASFAKAGEMRSGYGRYDAFYPAVGSYSAVRTCNAWTGEALRAAGVRIGRWTPFATTVMQWLPSA